VNVDAILTRIDTEQKATYAEMGFLLPELERKRKLIADTPQYCHGDRIACFYQFRGRQYVWFCAHVSYGQDGRIKIPAKAVRTADMPVGWFAVTRCRRCGDSFHFFMQQDRTIMRHRDVPSTFAQVADPSPDM
jgi:hypothetical protein